MASQWVLLSVHNTFTLIVYPNLKFSLIKNTLPMERLYPPSHKVSVNWSGEIGCASGYLKHCVNGMIMGTALLKNVDRYGQQ